MATISRICANRFAAAQRIGAFFRERVAVNRIDELAAGWPASAKPERVLMLRDKTLEVVAHWDGIAGGLQGLSDACRTFVDSYNRLMLKTFNGTLAPELALNWARICGYRSHHFHVQFADSLLMLSGLTAWTECHRHAIYRIRVGRTNLLECDSQLEL